MSDSSSVTAADFNRLAALDGGDPNSVSVGLALEFITLKGESWWVFLREDAAVIAAERILDEVPDLFYSSELDEELQRTPGPRTYVDVNGFAAVLLSLGVGTIENGPRAGERALGLNFKLLAGVDSQLCFVLPLDNAKLLALDLVVELSRRGHDELVC